MANRSCNRRRGAGKPPAAPLEQPRPVAPEPVMRRWPHPVPSAAPPLPPDPMLHYIRCALSYQNELLGEIKTLLEELAANREDN